MANLDPAFDISEPIDKLSVKEIKGKIRAWVTSNWLADLVTLFDGEISPEGSLDEVLAQLEAFSEKWDYRRIARERGAQADDQLRQGLGSARWLSATTGLPPETEARIIENVRHLGLVTAQNPIRASYDYIVMLGGARLSCKLRPLRAAEVMRAGVHAGKIALLGAARPIPDSERDATDTYAPGAADEFDLIVAGAQQAFGFNASDFEEERFDDPGNRNLSWIIRRFESSVDDQPIKILAISAPSSDPLRRRANSADTMIFFLDRETVRAGSKLLLITSQIYVPYVQLEALRTVALPHQILVETIGFPVEWMRELQGLSNANHYLQEVRSTIQAARRFCQTYPEQNE
jgi:hypothetical protein